MLEFQRRRHCIWFWHIIPISLNLTSTQAHVPKKMEDVRDHGYDNEFGGFWNSRQQRIWELPWRHLYSMVSTKRRRLRCHQRRGKVWRLLLLLDKVCNYWVQGNCSYGDRYKCEHAWGLRGIGRWFRCSLVYCEQVVSGIVLPSGSHKLYTRSKDEIDCWSLGLSVSSGN